MNALERIGTWIKPLAHAAGFTEVEKSAGPLIEPTSQTVTESSDLYDVIWGAGVFRDVHPILAYRLSLKSDVLGAVIHRIARQIAGFTLGLTTDDHDFDDNSPVIDFLNAGSEGYSKRRFFYEIAQSYLLTNEAWIVLRGRENRPPLSRTWVYPFDVILDQSAEDGLPASIRTIGDRDRRVYRRVERGGRLRWISDDKLNEIIPALGAEAIDMPYRGQSPIAPLLYSVQQNVEGKRHNTSVLKNGLRLTGAVMPLEGDRLEKPSQAKVVEALQAMRGSAVAGGFVVLPRALQTLDLALNNREMDYVKMLEEARDTVYNFYGIPLPLVSNDASTYNNYTTAQTALYDGAIFPVFDDIADALRLGLVPRFPELEDRRLTYNENTIKALKGRNIERMKKMRDTYSFTTDEIRDAGGYDGVDGGDKVLAPSTLMALDEEDGDFPATSVPAPGEMEEPEEEPDDETDEEENVEPE